MTLASMNYPLGSAAHQLYFREGSTDEWVIKQVLVDRQYDLRQTDRVSELMDYAARMRVGGRKPLIMDAGANIGAASVYFREQVPDAQIVAIEPAPDNFELLLRNVEGLGVETIKGAVGSTTGSARVVDPGRGEWAYRTVSITDTGDAAEAVPRVTIDDIFRAHAANTFPFLVKVDIEGAEGELFSANTDWVARTPLLIVELHDWLLPKLRTAQPFLRCIAQLDRDFVYLGESVFSIANDLETWAGP
jgi:FkbM family methyltransferase